MNFQIKSEKILSDRWGRLREVTFELPGQEGRKRTHKAEVYEKSDAIAVLLYNQEQGTVVLTRQFRLATVYNQNSEGMLVEVCAGHIEPGASPEETVRKELEEETGFVIRDAVPVMKLFMSPGILSQMLHLYVAAYSMDDKKSPGGGLPEEGELIDLLELPFADAMEMVRRGEIIDAKTVVLLQYVSLQGLLKA